MSNMIPYIIPIYKLASVKKTDSDRSRPVHYLTNKEALTVLCSVVRQVESG